MAPMAGITDVVFRLLIREMGAQAVVSELISAEGLVRGGQKTLDLMAFSPIESPVGIQLFGSDASSLIEAARIVQGQGADFVDINFGCPVKKVVCDGGGAAWLKDVLALGRLLTGLRQALRIPLSIKVRTGWDEGTRNLGEVVEIAADCGVDWLAVHGRTRAQGYSGVSDWEYIRQIATHSPIPIIGNGDILTAKEATRRIHEGYSHGVMIGRGALKSPWIFSEILGRDADRDILNVIQRHFELALEWKGDRRAFLSLKKFMGWYAAGYPHSSQFRSRIFQTDDVDALRSLVTDYFSQIAESPRIDDGQPFLMGGHG